MGGPQKAPPTPQSPSRPGEAVARLRPQTPAPPRGAVGRPRPPPPAHPRASRGRPRPPPPRPPPGKPRRPLWTEAMMAYEFTSLFTPIEVGGVTLKNRIYSSGHAEAMAEGGRPTERLRRYHESKARGGCALTIFGGSSSVHPSSPAAAWKQIANHDDSIIPSYRALADAVHAHGCLVFTQLTHLGRRAQSDPEVPGPLLAPSQIPERVHREVPHELEAAQIAELVRAFGEAARRCREGGLDGVEISMAHNHLIDQFWSPVFNERLDEYGGSLDNRMRFGLEVLAEIRRRVGRDFVVGARISGDELSPGGLGAADMAGIARPLAPPLRVRLPSVRRRGAPPDTPQGSPGPDHSLAPPPGARASSATSGRRRRPSASWSSAAAWPGSRPPGWRRSAAAASC